MSRRKRKYLLHLIGTILVLMLVGYLADKSSFTKSTVTKQKLTTQNSHFSQPPAGSEAVFVEPNTGTGPVISQIKSAQSSVDIVMYELEDMHVERALSDAAARGVRIRVLLNNGYYGVPNKSRPNMAVYNYSGPTMCQRAGRQHILL
jgi:phosphatidylserine/phosphatidylglycerophosphate/cardiolipin synthase-like enzyme